MCSCPIMTIRLRLRKLDCLGGSYVNSSLSTVSHLPLTFQNAKAVPIQNTKATPTVFHIQHSNSIQFGNIFK